MPVVSVNRDRLFEALGKTYSESRSESRKEQRAKVQIADNRNQQNSKKKKTILSTLSLFLI